MKYKLCVSSSLAFREKAEKTWGMERYKWPRDILKPVVFFGMYHIGDYSHFIKHLGKKIVFWTGSDITSLKNSHFPVYKLFQKTKCYCENDVEWEELFGMGIFSEVKPSFLEDIDDFPVSFEPSEKMHVYLSVRPNREKEYGVEIVKRIAPKVPDIFFHIYGYKGVVGVAYGNIIYEGEVSPEKFNEDIKKYHCGLRTNSHDGASEIMIKSVLMGQYPITKIKYPMIDYYTDEEELVALLKELKNKKEPNLKAREFWRNNVNNLPFINK